VDGTGERTVTGLPDGAMDRLLREAHHGAPARLLKRLDPATDPGLAGLLPGARRLVLVPFAVEQARGALLVEHGRRSGQRSSGRVERRMVSTAEQATLNASLALDRALLTERIRRAADTDALTGVANRRTLLAAVERAVAAAVAGGPPFGLLMLDLDHFKRLNDTYGHQTGDDVLRGAAAALRGVCGERDLPARYGGEELAVIVRRETVAEIADVAERLRLAVAGSSETVPVTASLGAAVCPAHGTDVAGLFAVADAALYEAKHGGRNRVVMAGPADAHESELGDRALISRPHRTRTS
jgi:two-component system cell cycle response regulator